MLYNGYSHLILTEILWGKFSHYHHFTERKWSLIRDELLPKDKQGTKDRNEILNQVVQVQSQFLTGNILPRI